MKVYLLNPPFVKNFIRSSRWARTAFAGSNWYPIFLAYATGLLEKHGHNARLVDALVDGWSHEEVIKDVIRFSPEMVVLYTSLPSLDNEINLAERIKREIDTYIVFVGPWCSINPEQVLGNAKAVDAIVRREFEYPVLNLAEGMATEKIKGLTWKKDGEIAHNDDGEFMTSKQLDEFPFVTDVYNRHLNIKNYIQSSLKRPFVDIFTGRGCAWGKCTFCLWPHTIHRGAKYRTRSIENVIEELKFVSEKMPFVKEIFIQDLNQFWIMILCNL
jgi:radical SAM superfamily enzyme YgiQ (UPF0313 family)